MRACPNRRLGTGYLNADFLSISTLIKKKNSSRYKTSCIIYSRTDYWTIRQVANQILLIPYNVKAEVIINCRLYYDLGLCPVSCNNESMSSAVLSEAVSLASSLDVSSRSF